MINPVARILGNLLIFAIYIYAFVLYGSDLDTYSSSVQEDQALEWSSFWAFVGASVIYLLVANRYRIAGRPIWLVLAAAAFCLVVALEEISWGQRLFGYQPPAYFLEHNYQQELNIHNVVDSDYRSLSLKAIILGFGVVLPLLALIPVCGRVFQRLALPVAPLSIAPAFIATYLAFEWYPIKHTGEWVELGLGLGFLFAAMDAYVRTVNNTTVPILYRRPATSLLIAWLGIIALGVISTPVFSTLWLDQATNIRATIVEIKALTRDFRASGMRVKCGLHKRLYSYIDQYDQQFLLKGRFAGLVNDGLPEGRAEFFLDPWNSPYWIKDSCARDGRSRTVIVYSFGPNRRRDTGLREIFEDDIGAYVSGGP